MELERGSIIGRIFSDLPGNTGKMIEEVAVKTYKCYDLNVPKISI